MADIITRPAGNLVDDTPYALVSQTGNLSIIMDDVYPSAVMRNMIVVETEHGSIYLDKDEPVLVQEKPGEKP